MVRPGWMVVAGTVALWVAGGCVFKGGAADPYRCGPGGACPEGLQCVDGICVTAVPGDAGSDAAAPDGQTDGPGQEDGPQQQDGGPLDGPPQQDAAPGCVFDPLTVNAGTFTAVLASSSWQFAATGYSQNLADDLHDTWISGAGGDHVSLQAVVMPTAQGRSLFSSPNGNFASAAGVIVRASGLSNTSATGYFCGVDLRGQRLLLGRMSGAYSASNGVFTILGSQSMTVSLNTAYPVRAEAVGDAITCVSGSTQIDLNDATVATGSVGLFTLGARARFTNAMYCLP
jgi:hypothetical protein